VERVSQTKRPPRSAEAEKRLKRENERLRRELAERERQLGDAKKQIADLERQLALRNQNSTITSKPPASDGLAGRQRVRGRRRKSRRKPGGQPGHPGHSRPLVPVARVSVIIDLVPDACGHCRRALNATEEAGDPRRYRTHLLHVPDDGAYSLVAAVWRPGQRTAVHDHIAWCVVGVHRGEEHEIRYRLVGEELVEDGHTVGPCGEVTVLTPPGDIHAVVNDGTAVAASLHVYGADLRRRRTSVRRCYDLAVRGPA